MRWPWNERRDRERDLERFVYWLSNEQGVHLGRHTVGFEMERIGTFSFDAERNLIAKYLERPA